MCPSKLVKPTAASAVSQSGWAHVPTRLAVANLQELGRPNETWQVFPRCSRNLLDTGTGLDVDDASATSFGSGLIHAIATFLTRQAA